MPDLAPLSDKKIIWADEVEAENQLKADADSLPPRQEYVQDGIKTIVDFHRDDNEKLIKMVSKYKVETKRVSKAVANRKKLAKFGAAKTDPPGPNLANTSIGEQIKIQFIRSRGGELLEFTKTQDDDVLTKLKSVGIRCRYCKATDHGSVRCPYKDLVENTTESLEGVSGAGGGGTTDDNSRRKEAEEKMRAGTYVSPAMRGGPSSSMRSSTDTRRDDFTVRITNLPEETTEEDLKEICDEVAKVQRVFLAKDKTTMRCKGYAFVTFTNKDDAERAIVVISGHRYEHLILKVEWARPTNN